MTANTTREITEQIEGYANTLMQSFRVLDERRYILEPLLHDEDIKSALSDKFDNSYGSHAYNHLAPLLAQDLVRDICRLFLDDDRRAGSMVNLHRKAAVPKIHKALRDKWVYADSCGLILAFLGSGGRNAATILSLRYSSSR